MLPPKIDCQRHLLHFNWSLMPKDYGAELQIVQLNEIEGEKRHMLYLAAKHLLRICRQVQKFASSILMQISVLDNKF